VQGVNRLLPLKKPTSKKTETMKKCILYIVSTLYLCASGQEYWSYEHNGTKDWGKNAATCDLGKAQSPINIVTSTASHTTQQFELEFHPKLVYRADVIDNGHSIKVTPKRQPYITINKKRYNLLQFHYHGKSEHSVDGKFYDLVIHAVYQEEKSKALAVVAVFFEEGKEDKLLAKVLNNINKSIMITSNLLPSNREHYYHYKGSLTTPPCSENLNWYILKQPMQASKAQIEALRKYYVNNYRPVQELYNRKIDMH